MLATETFVKVRSIMVTCMYALVSSMQTSEYTARPRNHYICVHNFGIWNLPDYSLKANGWLVSYLDPPYKVVCQPLFSNPDPPFLFGSGFDNTQWIAVLQAFLSQCDGINQY